MAGKTDFIHCRIDTPRKKKLQEKAKQSGCKDLTAFLEKIADNTIIIVDPNVQNLLNSMAGAITTR